MLDYMGQIANAEHLKDLYREAENERLARQATSNKSDFLRETRNLLGRELVKVGQKLLDEKQR